MAEQSCEGLPSSRPSAHRSGLRSSSTAASVVGSGDAEVRMPDGAGQQQDGRDETQDGLANRPHFYLLGAPCRCEGDAQLILDEVDEGEIAYGSAALKAAGEDYIRSGVAWCNATDTMPLQCDHLVTSRARMSGGE